MFLLGTRSRIEALEKKLWPGKLKEPYNRADVWTQLLTSQEKKFLGNSRLMKFREMMVEAGFSLSRFLNVVTNLYSTLSDDAVHKIAFLCKIPKT
jgi:hypothetical protein